MALQKKKQQQGGPAGKNKGESMGRNETSVCGGEKPAGPVSFWDCPDHFNYARKGGPNRLPIFLMGIFFFFPIGRGISRYGDSKKKLDLLGAGFFFGRGGRRGAIRPKGSSPGTTRGKGGGVGGKNGGGGPRGRRGGGGNRQAGAKGASEKSPQPGKNGEDGFFIACFGLSWLWAPILGTAPGGSRRFGPLGGDPRCRFMDISDRKIGIGPHVRDSAGGAAAHGGGGNLCRRILGGTPGGRAMGRGGTGLIKRIVGGEQLGGGPAGDSFRRVFEGGLKNSPDFQAGRPRVRVKAYKIPVP